MENLLMGINAISGRDAGNRRHTFYYRDDATDRAIELASETIAYPDLQHTYERDLDHWMAKDENIIHVEMRNQGKNRQIMHVNHV